MVFCCLKFTFTDALGKQFCIHFQTGYVLYLLEWVSGEEAMVFCLPKLHASYN